MLAPILLALATTPAADPVPSRLAVIRDVPAFKLTASDGGTVTEADLKGRVTLVGFVFTTCGGTCPATTQRMAGVQSKLTKAKIGTDAVRLLTITLDPERDTADMLLRYAKKHEADPARWRFLTGSPADVGATIQAWDMWVKASPNGQLDHPSRVHLVDRAGRIREVYNLDFLQPGWVLEDVRELLAEPE